MDAETIALLIKWGPLAIIGVVFLWCFILGVIKGTYKVLRRMLYVVLYVVIVWLSIDYISGAILDLNIKIDGVSGVRNYIVYLLESNEDVNTFFSYTPSLKEIIVEQPEILINPILFLVLVFVVLPLSFPIYWVYLIIFNLIAKLVFHRHKYERNGNGEILRNEKGKKIKVKRKKRRLLGGLLRGVQGVVVFSIVLLPVNFVNRIYNEAKNTAELEENETLCVSFGMDPASDMCAYLELYNETILAKLGGEKSLDKYIMDKLTTAENENVRINLEEELSNVAVIAVLLNDSGLLELFLEGEINLDTLDLSKIKFDKLNLVIDRLFSSSLISEVVRAGTDYLMNEVVKDNLVDLLKDEDIIGKINYETSEQIKNDIKSVIGVVELAVEKGLLDTAIDNRDNVVEIVNKIDSLAVEEMLTKILNIRIINTAMPSVLNAYVSEYGVGNVDKMTDELNSEVTKTLGNAIRFVQTMEVTKLEDLTEGNMVDNLSNALFENGALKSSSKESLATLLHDINSSYLFSNVIPSQVNKLLEDKDYKVDARVIRYVDSKEAWMKELDVLDVGYKLYDEYNESNIVNYDNITGLLNKTKGTKIVISILPFAYDELLPKIGIEIDSEGLPVIDFDKDTENASKELFYETWEAELTVLKNVADSLELLELQNTDEITVDLLKDENKIDAMSSAISEVYKSELLKEPFVEFFVDYLNDFVEDYEVKFSYEELLVIDQKDEWVSELTNIKEVLDVDIKDVNNVTSENLEVIFTSVGNMQLFAKKKIDILKYAVRQSEILSSKEYDEVDWPDDTSSQVTIDAFWDNETEILLDIVDEKDMLEDLENFELETMDTVKIGNLVDTVMDSNIWNSMVVNKLTLLFEDVGVGDDRDVNKENKYLKENIGSVSEWDEELDIVQELLNINDENYDIVDEGEVKTKLELALDRLDNSDLFYTMRGSLLLKAVGELKITDIPSDVTKASLAENEYEDYLHEKAILVDVSNNREVFDELSSMELKDIDTSKVGGLLNSVTSSLIFGDYVADEMVSVFVNVAKVSDDRDKLSETKYLKENIKNVDEWDKELDIVQELLNIDDKNYDIVDEGEVKTKLELALDRLDNSDLFYTMRGSLLLKAVGELKITDIPSDVTKASLAENEYEDYLHEKAILVDVSNNRELFDALDTMELKNINTDKVGNLMNKVRSSVIFGDYVVDEMVKAFAAAEVYDDRDEIGQTNNLRSSIALVNAWDEELAVVQEMLNIDATNYAQKIGEEGILDKLDEGLFEYKRATLLIKALDSIDIDGLKEVTVAELRGEYSNVLEDYPYEQYLIEKSVFVNFAKADIDNLGDITKVSEENTNNIAAALDSMKNSVIFGNKYVLVLDSSLGEISNNKQLKDYGVNFKGKAETNNYMDIEWSAKYDDENNLVKRNEIYNLIIIGNNIETVSKYDTQSLKDNAEEVISVIGSTLDAIEASAFLGEESAQAIANQVIVKITGISEVTISKGAYDTWADAFNSKIDQLKGLGIL